MSIGNLQFYTVLLKQLKDDCLSKEDINKWLEVQIDELGTQYEPLEVLEFIQVNTRKFAELITEEILRLKSEIRKPVKEKLYYSAPEIYQGLNKTKGTFTNWKNKGWFPNAKKGTKSWLIPKDDLEDFLENHKRLKDIWESKNPL